MATVANAQRSEPVRLPDRIGLRAAKATLPDDFEFGPDIWEVIVKGHGSVKEAAFTMGKTDPSLLRRQILDGSITLRKLMTADPKALAAFGEFLKERFGESHKTKKQIAREQLPAVLAALVETVTAATAADAEE